MKEGHFVLEKGRGALRRWKQCEQFGVIQPLVYESAQLHSVESREINALDATRHVLAILAKTIAKYSKYIVFVWSISTSFSLPSVENQKTRKTFKSWVQRSTASNRS